MSSIASWRKISVGSSSLFSSSPSCSSYHSPVASAFWKIVGFEVTPTMASSSISRASSPVSSISRDTESIQGLTPASYSSCSRDVAILHLLLHRFDLFQSLHVPLAAVEARAEEGAREVDGELGADHLGAEAEHVHIVVLDALMRRVDVVADRGSNPGELAGGDRGAHARAADEDPALGVAVQDRVAELARLVRVVDTLRIRVGAEVDRLVSERVELLQQALAELHAPVVERNRNPHVSRPARAGQPPGRRRSRA